MNFVHWDKTVYDEFCREAILKPREQRVMFLHVHTDYTCEHIGDEVGYSVETVKRDIKNCKKKYRNIAKRNKILRDAIYRDDIIDNL